jgi:hypothetical protein
VATLIVIVIWAILLGLAILTLGLIAVAVLAGLAIGAAVRRGAWSGAAHAPSGQLGIIASILAAAAWLGGTYGGYVASLLLIPGSQVDLAQRMANVPFSQFIGEQQGPFVVLQMIVLVVLAARTATR